MNHTTPRKSSVPAQTKPAESHRYTRWLRGSAVAIFLSIAALALASFVLVSWVERQILTADNWVSYSSELPQHPAVSWAVADVLTKQIFKNVPVEQTIADVLPPRASFLAGPLTDQLQTRTVAVVQKVEASDTFSSVWTGANRLAIERFLANARSEKTPLAERVNDKFNIDISGLRPMLQERLGKQASLSPSLGPNAKQALAVTADLQAKRERLWQVVRTTDFVHAILPAVFLASLLGMLVFAAERRKAVMVLACFTIVLLLVELIAIKYGRQQVLDQVQNEPYIPAVSHIFDSLVSGLRQSILYMLGLWVVVLGLCFVAGPARWAVRTRDFLRLGNLAASKPADWWHTARAYVAQYRYAVWGGIGALTLSYLAFGASITNENIVNGVLIVVSGIFLTQLIADTHSPYRMGVTETKRNK